MSHGPAKDDADQQTRTEQPPPGCGDGLTERCCHSTADQRSNSVGGGGGQGNDGFNERFLRIQCVESLLTAGARGQLEAALFDAKR